MAYIFIYIKKRFTINAEGSIFLKGGKLKLLSRKDKHLFSLSSAIYKVVKSMCSTFKALK